MTYRIGKIWIDWLIAVSLLVNAVVVFLVWLLCFGPLSFQSVKTFEVLASGLVYIDKDGYVENVICRKMQRGSLWG